MILQLPVTNDANQQMVIDWMDRSLEFIVFWADEGECWYLNLNDYTTGEALLRGIALVTGVDIFEPFALGIGSLIVSDENNTGEDPTFDGFGDDFGLYLTDEL